MSQDNNLTIIEANLFFKGVDKSVIKSVFNPKNFRAEKEGELIFHAGEESNSLYLILQGEVKLKYAGTKGTHTSFRRIKNEFFGETEILHQGTRNTSAIADTDCIFYLINKQELLQLIATYKIILKNLSFDNSLEEEDSAEESISIELPQLTDELKEETSSEEDKENKMFEEIVMDEDFVESSFDIPANEELHDFLDDSYLSYLKESNDDDLNFDNNGFDQENKFEEEPAEEASENIIDNKILNEELPKQFEKVIEENKNSAGEESHLRVINEFENIPQEPEKFAFAENDSLEIQNNSFNEPYRTETITLIESAEKFVNNNIAYPLSEIKKYSQYLSTHSSSETFQINKIIIRQADSVQSIVESTMEFLSGGYNLDLNKQNINTVMNDILSILSEYVDSRNVNLYKRIETEASVNVDPKKLFNAFFQIAKNACDAMPEGGNLFVNTTEDDNQVKIEFIDEGPGIPSSFSYEIFEPMITHGKPDGAGLGLSIAKKIIQDHHGDILLDGELGEGTKIIVTLPVL